MKVFVLLLAVVCYLESIQGTRLSCEYDNTFIAKNNYKEMKDVSLETCKRLCITDRHKKCKSADYDKKQRRCAFSALSYIGAKGQDLVRTNSNFKLITVCPTVRHLHMYDGLYVGVNNYHEVRDVTAQQCKNLCEADPKCVHAEFAKDISRCKFSSKTCAYFHEKNLVRRSDNYVLIASCPFVSTCHFDKTFINTPAYKVIRSISEEECRYECMTDPSLKCKSAKYNKKIQRCFLMTMTYLQAKEQHLLRTNKPDFSLVSACPTVEDSSFLEFADRFIAKNNYANIKGMLKEECREACLLDLQCKSAEYRARDKRCFLSKMSCAEAKKQDLVRESDEYVLMATCPLVKSCDKPGKFITGGGRLEMRGLTTEGCKMMCLTQPKDDCLYAQYNKKINRCFLSFKQSFKDAQRMNLLRASPIFNLYHQCE